MLYMLSEFLESRQVIKEKSKIIFISAAGLAKKLFTP